MDIKRFETIKGRIEQLQREQAKAEGVLDQLLEEMRTKYGCKDIRHAEKILVKKTQEADEAEEQYQEALSRFEKEWGHLLKEAI